MPPEFIDVEIFAGAGGLAIGLYSAGFTDAFFYEIDEHSCETLSHNICSQSPTLSGVVHQFDVTGLRDFRWRRLRLPVRLLAAGSPCQPFSLGGKHLADQDGRNLFPQILRAMRNLNPQVVLLENVRGLLRASFKPYFDYILRQLECPSVKPQHNELWQHHDARIQRRQRSRGYQPEYIVTWKLIDAADLGVPQNRLRVAYRCRWCCSRAPARISTLGEIVLTRRVVRCSEENRHSVADGTQPSDNPPTECVLHPPATLVYPLTTFHQPSPLIAQQHLPAE
jgi:site-specific DNA-cytosine methylase